MLSDRELFKRLKKTGGAFYGQFRKFREIQRIAIEPILNGESILIASATASGKTEALYAPLIERLIQERKPQRNSTRVLAIAPTRALVNDLFHRLDRPLREIGWSCGRQTSDHKDKYKRPHLLLTTPESFDSMLVRDAKYRDGHINGHLLANVEAVVIDEVHVFDGTSRGDQLIWLLGRLRHLRAFSVQHGWSSSGNVQVCGASATVAHSDKLACRLLCDHAVALTVLGARDIRVLLNDVESSWCSLGQIQSITELRDRLIRVYGQDDLDSITHHICRALAGDQEITCRKLLVFVPTRALCDKLSTHLRDQLTKYRDIEVLAHHGSLERTTREYAEKIFSRARDSVLVATTTLEVGVDIGDVDGVVLVGPPMDTGGLLQRIGRGGRRDQITKVVPIVRDGIEACAMSSMLLAANEGRLDEKPYARRWSVFVQQAASYVAQAKKGRRKQQIVDLAESIWPEGSHSNTARIVLENLIENEHLVESNRRVNLGEVWSDLLEKGGGALHNNLDAEAGGVPVVDATTGEIIARVQDSRGVRTSLALGGQRWNVISESGEIILKSAKGESTTATFRYASRKAPTSRSYARHVLMGLGFQPDEAPILEGKERGLWLHCGGSAYEAVILSLFDDLKSISDMKGLAVKGIPDMDQIDSICKSIPHVRIVVSEIADKFAFSLSPGPFHRYLPDEIRQEVILSLFDVDKFVEWLGSRRLTNGEAALSLF